MSDNSKALSLVNELKARGKLPALDSNVGSICNLTEDPTTCVADLTTVILRDCSLTSTLISTSNSAAYAPSEPIKTVSAAITLLGFEKVKSLALGLVLIKQISQSAQGRNLYRLFACSYFSGLFSMALGRKAKLGNPEELLVSGVLTSLPRLLLANGFPERYASMEKRILSEKIPVNQACLQEFGVTYEALTAEVARFWNMPSNIARMLGAPTQRDAQSSLVSGGAQVADMLFGNSAGGEAAMDAVQSRLRAALDMKHFALAEFIEKTCEEDSNVKRFFKLSAKDVEMMVKIVEWGKVDTAQLAATLTYGAATQEMQEREQDPALIVGQYLAELVLNMRKTPDINRMLLTSLEAIYRCVRPETVLVAFINKETQRLEGRFIVGSSTGIHPRDFRLPLSDVQSPINQCLKNLQPITLAVSPELPMPIFKKMNLQIIRLAPILVGDNAVGVFILGRQKLEPFTGQETLWLDAIVTNVSMGFERAKYNLNTIKW